ncbi:hypothetical protein, partial [Pseudomonas helleri]|uniref:hypothetical protein n=1 Tax=Pseudomonas helleri TaxID=1608996 RepID=UPI001E60A046
VGHLSPKLKVSNTFYGLKVFTFHTNLGFDTHACSARYPSMVRGNGTSTLFVADNFIAVGHM